MRFALLMICVAIAAVVFLGTLAATVAHRLRHCSEAACRDSALAEYLWAVVPWAMVAAGAFPAVRRIVAGH